VNLYTGCGTFPFPVLSVTLLDVELDHSDFLATSATSGSPLVGSPAPSGFPFLMGPSLTFGTLDMSIEALAGGGVRFHTAWGDIDYVTPGLGGFLPTPPDGSKILVNGNLFIRELQDKTRYFFGGGGNNVLGARNLLSRVETYTGPDGTLLPPSPGSSFVADFARIERNSSAQVTSIHTSRGETVTFAYTAPGGPLSSISLSSDIGGPYGDPWTFQPDPKGRLGSMSSPSQGSGTVTTTFGYDDNGLLTSETGPNAELLQFVRAQDTGNVGKIEAVNHGVAGNPTAISQTNFGYSCDSTTRTTDVLLPFAAKVTYQTAIANRRLNFVTDPSGRRTAFTWNADLTLAQLVDPDATLGTAYGYDPTNGMVNKVTELPSGRVMYSVAAFQDGTFFPSRYTDGTTGTAFQAVYEAGSNSLNRLLQITSDVTAPVDEQNVRVLTRTLAPSTPGGIDTKMTRNGVVQGSVTTNALGDIVAVWSGKPNTSRLLSNVSRAADGVPTAVQNPQFGSQLGFSSFNNVRLPGLSSYDVGGANSYNVNTGWNWYGQMISGFDQVNAGPAITQGAFGFTQWGDPTTSQQTTTTLLGATTRSATTVYDPAGGSRVVSVTMGNGGAENPTQTWGNPAAVGAGQEANTCEP
jgi:hypothetical protein